MPNQEEIERALRELFQDVQTVQGTLPPVYTCGDFLIGFDRQGQIKVTGSIKTKPEPPATESHWFKRWFSERGRWIRVTEAP